MDLVRVKGKNEPVGIIEILHNDHHLWNKKEAIEKYEKAYSMFYSRNFQGCHEIMTDLLRMCPEDKACIRYKQWCEDYLKTPPEKDWDGVFTHTTKG